MHSDTVRVMPRASLSLLWVIYLVAGGIVSATHNYWSNLDGLKPILSAIIALLLWPLLLFGVDLHLR
jgi:hypothetical protein